MPSSSPSPRRAQMADIARIAGVSSSTVSRALNDSPLIPLATRQRIMELARSLDYQINVGAANLRKRSVKTVGVVVLGDSTQAISDPFILSLFGSVADALDAQGNNVLLTRLNEERQDEMQTLITSGTVSGLVVIGQSNCHSALNRMAHAGLKLSVWGALLPDAAYPVVGGNNEQGGYLATAHLLGKGCKRIAFFGDTEHPETALRHAGYLRAHREAGVTPDGRLKHPILFSEPLLRNAVAEWLAEGLEFDGVFASSDVTAIAVISTLHARGIEVPRQVKVVGYDNIAMAAHVFPSLTTVSQPTQAAGQGLVTLLNEAQTQQPMRSIMLPATLIERESTR